MKALLERRTSVSVGDATELARASWPFGKLTMLDDHLVLEAGFRRFRLPYRDIQRVRFLPFQVQIEHGSPSVPEHVDVRGVFIARAISTAITANRLPLAVD